MDAKRKKALLHYRDRPLLAFLADGVQRMTLANSAQSPCAAVMARRFSGLGPGVSSRSCFSESRVRRDLQRGQLQFPGGTWLAYHHVGVTTPSSLQRVTQLMQIISSAA